MARPLSNALLKGMTSLSASHCLRTTVLGSSRHHGMKYSTTITSDSDTHDDFKPTDKLAGHDLSAINVVEKDVNENPVMIYMKGVPSQPQCGFSALAVRILDEYKVPLKARNILTNPEIKSAVKDFSKWPTFPQIFIQGEFVGGSDIILNMHQTGELKNKLSGIASGVNAKKSE